MLPSLRERAFIYLLFASMVGQILTQSARCESVLEETLRGAVFVFFGYRKQKHNNEVDHLTLHSNYMQSIINN